MTTLQRDMNDDDPVSKILSEKRPYLIAAPILLSKNLAMRRDSQRR